MAYKVFKEMRLSRVATVPQGYSRSVRWLPQIGDVVPNFLCETTRGPVTFHDFAEGAWVFLFSHPAPFTPVCTSELAAFAAASADFEARGVKLLGISCGSLEDQHRWHGEIERLYDVAVDFPVAADESGLLADLFGMIHAHQSRDYAIRKSFVIGPDLKVRMIFEYPMMVGRSTDEAIRVVDALQTVEKYNVGVGADWRKGDDCLLLPAAFGPARIDHGLSWRRITAYLKTVADPWSGRDEGEPLPFVPARQLVEADGGA